MFFIFQEFSEAIDLSSQAIEIKPDNYDGYFARSKAYLEFGNLSEALRDAKLAVQKSNSTTPEIKNTLLLLHDNIIQKQFIQIEGTENVTDL